VALVGYTNAGKSTLCNALCRSDVLVENRLFSTLDPVTRRLNLPHGGHALLTDTVGFIQKLPPTLVAAFRATLEEMGEADLLMEVVDLNHPYAAQQVHSVQQVLRELALERKAVVLVLNKVDLCKPGDDLEEHIEILSRQGHRVVRVSAAAALGLDTLLGVVEEEIMKATPERELC
jgi:GTP-binding protein HflX